MSEEITTVEASQALDDASFFSGFARPRVTESKIVEAADLMGKAFKGNRIARLRLEEAFSTSDFQLAAFAAIDKMFLAQYEELQPSWQQYSARTEVRDFLPKRIEELSGARTRRLRLVPELSEYPTFKLGIGSFFELLVKKYGARFALSWEAWINDTAIQELEDLPGKLTEAAGLTEAAVTAAQLVNETTGGVNLDNFNATNGNAPGTDALTATNLDTRLETLSMKQIDGRYVIVNPGRKWKLIVPPTMQRAAERLLAVGAYTYVDTEGRTIEETNTLPGRVDLVVDPMILELDSDLDKAWFLLPDPNGPHPAIFTGFLRGHTTPDLRVKADTGSRIGGGSIPSEEGSFDIDDIQYRVRHVVGSTFNASTNSYASTGE